MFTKCISRSPETLLIHLVIIIVVQVILVANEQNETKAEGQNLLFDISKESFQPQRYALSATYLSYLAIKEQEVYKLIKSYNVKVDDELQRNIDAYIQDYEATKFLYDQMLDSKSQDAESSLLSTLSPYLMIRRFANEFRNIRSRLRGPLQEKIRSILDGVDLPTQQDHDDAMEGFLRLHYFYNIKMENLTSGHPNNFGLMPKHTIELANYALSQRYYTLTFDWIKATENITGDENIKNEMIKRLINMHDNDWGRNEPAYMFAQRLQDHQSIETVPRLRDINLSQYVGKLEDNKLNNHFNFIALCNGQNLQTEKLKAQLFCKYDTVSHPYWKINPLKIETLNTEPSLVQFYDVVSDSEIKALIQISLPTLERAPTSRATPRTATYAWLSDESIANSTQLISKIEYMTGLNVFGEDASEYLQIAAYASGGHVSMHVDSLPESGYDPTVRRKGNRVSTFLIYLNDVKHGGRTAFPLIGTFVEPVKGSGVLWFTSKKNGSIDRRLLHAACPVFGQKWIATKWTHLHKNFLTRKCSKDPKE